ncbi:Rho termination factor N-terminal domain-containing protein [Nodosilinea sp. LEGE 06152]|nr:Rho termination factor N-terminal domain-containing protein [Nodosilinea sp. LEGE 06152]
MTPELLPKGVTDRALLKSLNTQQLKAMAKERDIEGFSKPEKADLVNLLAAA